MDSFTFAKLLANCFQTVVPEGFHVDVEGDTLRFTLDEGLGFWGGSTRISVRDFLDKVDAPEDWRVATAAEFALNDLQDFVDEESTEPWPGQHAPPVAHAAVRAGKLHMWFGDEGNEDLILQPIDLSPEIQP